MNSLSVCPPPLIRPYRFIDFQRQSTEAKFATTFGLALDGKNVLLQWILSDEIWLPATLAKIVNVLQHTSGYFKQQFSFDGKQEMQKLFSQYRHGVMALTMQIKLLNCYVPENRPIRPNNSI